MSKETYHSYYQEYQRLVSEYAASPSSPELFNELQTILQQMSTEARCMTNRDDKKECLERTMQYKKNVASMRQKQDRSELLSDSNHVASNNQDDMLTRQNETLERAKRTILETEETSLEIQQELARNKTTLQSSQAKINDLSDMTQQAGAIVKNMTSPWWRRR